MGNSQKKWVVFFWGFVAILAALVLPFLLRTQAFRRLGGRGLRWALHLTAVVGVLVLLTWLNRALALEELVKDHLLPFPGTRGIHLNHYWLPILFGLVYLLGWLGWWLWQLLRPEEDLGEVPDIHAAWEEAVDALGRAGISLTQTPLFLVLGRPQGTEEALFRAADSSWHVHNVPPGPDAPLHVYANHDGIYVTCAGASLLGRYVAWLQEQPAFDPRAAAGVRETDDDEYKTARAGEGLNGERLAAVQAVLRRTQGGHPSTEAERAQVRSLADPIVGGRARPSRGAGRAWPESPAEAEHAPARLRYLCRLIARDRQPYCPVNGILLLVPFAGTETEVHAQRTGGVCHTDLLTARSALRLQCPVFALVCDLETVPGFREFVQRMPAPLRRNRLGQRFPLLPDLPEAVALRTSVDRSVQALCQTLMPTWVFKLFQLEAGAGDYAAVVDGNARLYDLMDELRGRQRRLADLLGRALTVDASTPWLFGGCYLAGTGRDAEREQAFSPGVLRRLIDHQSAVAWTPDVFVEDAENRWWAKAGYIVLMLVAAAAGSALFLAILGK
jgi:hypothetical protein